MERKIGIVCAGKMGNLHGIDLSGVALFEEVKMSEAGNLAAELESEGAQAIIATAGTAAGVRERVSVPVIVTYLTYFDILENLKEVETNLGIVNKKVALILHDENPFDVERLYPFLQNRMSLFKYQDEKNLRDIIHMLFEKDYELLVGGPTTISCARQLGMKAHLLTFSKEAILATINEAKSILALTQKDREQTQRLKTVIDIFPDGILATDHLGIVSMCNPRALALLNLLENEVLGKKVDEVAEDSSWRKVYENGVKQTDVLMENKRNKIFSTRQPIVENGHIIGSVGTLQDVVKIQKLEHKFRSIQTLGLVAKYTFNDIVGDSPMMKETMERAKAFARFDSTILIEGETGTGKEIFAQSIHNACSRHSGPFVAINCATLSETLLESELLGYEEGAFTGAKRGGKIGLFELAHRGTIFLDEINQIPLQLQAKILRVIQEKVVLRLGGERVIPIDVRIIAATNENLKEKINAGKFRDDLYYRINVLNLQLPSLRNRKEDISALIQHFLKIFSSSIGLVKGTPEELVQLALGYDWPGNVRELSNYVERYAVLSQGLELSNLRFSQEFQMGKEEVARNNQAVDSLTLKMNTLENMEKEIMWQVVERCGGNKLHAALLLGISRSTVWKKLRNV